MSILQQSTDFRGSFLVLELEYLHTLCSPRIIHRDIKSENILLTRTMVPKVANFGLSRWSADTCYLFVDGE